MEAADNSPQIYCRAARVLAPAGGFASPAQLLRDAAALRSEARGPRTVAPVSDLFLSKFEVGEIRFFESGKAALFVLFQALKNLLTESRDSRNAVAMSAYTCPDVAVAAIRAGFSIFPLELDAASLEPLSDELHRNRESIAAVVLSNLYGLPDSVASLGELADSCLVIDDACQAAFSSANGFWTGARPGTAGILSFGRGKALNGVGGGALLLPSKSAQSGILEELTFAPSLSPGRGALQDAKEYLKSALFWAMEVPELYRVPANLPFLGLGKTEAVLEFGTGPCSTVQLLVAYSQLRARDKARRIHAANALRWHTALEGAKMREPFIERGYSFNGDVSPIRYPVLFADRKVRDCVWQELQKRGLGASRSYGRVLSDFVTLAPHLISRATPKAREAAECLLTLPVHRHVRPDDVTRAAEIIRSINSEER